MGRLRSVSLAVSLWVIYSSLVSSPPGASTLTTLHFAKRRVTRFVRLHNHLPSALADTEPLPYRKQEGICDEWGKTIIFEVSENGVVSLKSLGSDMKVGGTECAKDLFGTFDPKDHSDDNPDDDYVDWIKHPAMSGVTQSVRP